MCVLLDHFCKESQDYIFCHFLCISHFDSVTSIAFHPTEQVVLTGSEDCTLKVWNLQRARQKIKETRRLVECDYTASFRMSCLISGCLRVVGIGVLSIVAGAGGVNEY